MTTDGTDTTTNCPNCGHPISVPGTRTDEARFDEAHTLLQTVALAIRTSGVKPHSKESTVQHRLAKALRACGFDVVREHIINPDLRADLLVDSKLVIEVKVAGSMPTAFAQVQRYLQADGALCGALVVTTTGDKGLTLPTKIETTHGDRPFAIEALQWPL